MRKEFLPYFRPSIDNAEIDAVTTCLRSGWLTSGPRVTEFEAAFASSSGVPHAVALNSGTAALHLALAAFGIGPGDEVVMPALTFVAGAQCVLHLGATPVFADVDPETLCLTAKTVSEVATSRTKVIMPMHYGGQPLAIDEIVGYARAQGWRVIEDAAHAAGTLDEQGRWAGVASDAAAYSFYATKNVTSAEGGMLVTNDSALAEKVRILALHGMDRDAWRRYTQGGRWRYDVTAAGYKYNMADMAASLGLVQLGKLQQMQLLRDSMASFYRDAIAAIPGLRTAAPLVGQNARHSWCIFAVLVDEREAGISRDKLIEALYLQHIGTSVHFIPTQLFSAFRNLDTKELPVTEKVWPGLISLPLYPGMQPDDLASVVQALQDITTRARRSSRHSLAG